jgi:N-acetylmuramoyl-L-alanine amidase
MKILIDNGHGEDTAGKRSPEGGALREYKWAREMAVALETILKASGYDAERIVPEENDIKLSVRCRRVNAVCSKAGAKNVLLVSIHNDAAGDGSAWHDARGLTVHIAPNASSRSKTLATCIYDRALKAGEPVTGNRKLGKDKYVVQSLAICRDTNCPAVLVENLFQDNKEDVAYLLSAEGKNTLLGVMYNGIVDYINTFEK